MVQNRTGKLRDIVVNSILAIWQIIRRDLYCLDHRCSYPASSNPPASAPLHLTLLSGTFYGALRLFKGPWHNWTVTPHSSTWECLQLPANSHIFYATNQMSQTGQSQSLEEKKKITSCFRWKPCWSYWGFILWNFLSAIGCCWFIFYLNIHNENWRLLAFISPNLKTRNEFLSVGMWQMKLLSTYSRTYQSYHRGLWAEPLHFSPCM